jgi:hypothetical protein
MEKKITFMICTYCTISRSNFNMCSSQMSKSLLFDKHVLGQRECSVLYMYNSVHVEYSKVRSYSYKYKSCVKFVLINSGFALFAKQATRKLVHVVLVFSSCSIDLRGKIYFFKGTVSPDF